MTTKKELQEQLDCITNSNNSLKELNSELECEVAAAITEINNQCAELQVIDQVLDALGIDKDGTTHARFMEYVINGRKEVG
jgi:cytochrome c-type biogenesis protein CcmH/NrfF